MLVTILPTIRTLATLLVCASLLSACATRMDIDPASDTAQMKAQNRLLLTPSNGGQAITGAALQPGDIILSSTNGINSLGIRVLTVSPVSHAAIYLGDACIRGIAAIQLGASKNDRFFCSQLVLEAYRHAGLPLATQVTAPVARTAGQPLA